MQAASSPGLQRTWLNPTPLQPIERDRNAFSLTAFKGMKISRIPSPWHLAIVEFV